MNTDQQDQCVEYLCIEKHYAIFGPISRISFSSHQIVGAQYMTITSPTYTVSNKFE